MTTDDGTQQRFEDKLYNVYEITFDTTDPDWSLNTVESYLADLK